MMVGCTSLVSLMRHKWFDINGRWLAKAGLIISQTVF